MIKGKNTAHKIEIVKIVEISDVFFLLLQSKVAYYSLCKYSIYVCCTKVAN